MLSRLHFEEIRLQGLARLESADLDPSASGSTGFFPWPAAIPRASFAAAKFWQAKLA